MRKLLVSLSCVLIAAALGCHRTPAADPRVIPAFLATTELLKELAAAPDSVVPDAVLNRARCVIIIPHDEKQASSPGASSCRDRSEKWDDPALITYAPGPRPEGDVLIFILSDRTAAQLKAGGVKWNNAALAGPTAQNVITVTDADLSADALSYVRGPSGLAGKSIKGEVTVQQAGALIAAAEPPSSRQVSRAVTSFFNTITPIGIILHHSAVIPGQQKVPGSEDEVDAFHRERGFDILCQGREFHVAYHYLLLADGTIKRGRPEKCQGAHAKGYNSYLGIALVGDFSSADNPNGDRGQAAPTPEQMSALAQLCRRIMSKYNIPLQRVLRHSDVGSTRCPGDRFPFAPFLQTLQGNK